MKVLIGVDPAAGNETFVVRAWPGARLWLTVACGGSWRRSVPLEIGESGLWKGDLPGLGIAAPPAEGEMVITVSWKDLVNRTISVRSRIHGSGLPRFAWSEIRGERVLTLQGSEGEDGLALLDGDTLVLGERPWLGELWDPVVRGAARRRLGRMEDVVDCWLALRALDLLDQGGHGPRSATAGETR